MVITSRTNQDRQTVSLVEIFPDYISIKVYGDWAESFCGMERKEQDNFIQTAVPRRDCGTINTAGVFEWHVDVLDTEDEYNRDYKLWDRNLTAGIKQRKEHVNNGKYISIVIQGQVEPSLWD